MSSAAVKKARFEFGRHETFAVRHGWLGKGMAQILLCMPLQVPRGWLSD